MLTDRMTSCQLHVCKGSSNFTYTCIKSRHIQQTCIALYLLYEVVTLFWPYVPPLLTSRTAHQCWRLASALALASEVMASSWPWSLWPWLQHRCTLQILFSESNDLRLVQKSLKFCLLWLENPFLKLNSNLHVHVYVKFNQAYNPYCNSVIMVLTVQNIHCEYTLCWLSEANLLSL
jgi:hypothetical protein